MNNSDDRITGIKRFLKALRYAVEGLFYMLNSERNIRIQLVVLTIALIAGIFLNISTNDWIAICLSAGLVLAAESFNTAIERLSDSVTTEQNEKIKRVKDIAAAGVLLTAIASIAVGLIVFIPAILKVLHL
jgi:diacylglycerol kinase